MFTPMKTADPRVVAFDATGKVTDDDYRSVLIPALEKAIEAQGKVRCLIRFGPEFSGYTPRAMFDDATFGIAHLRDFARVAVASDVEWIVKGVSMFSHLSPIPVRVFAANETEAAITWLRQN